MWAAVMGLALTWEPGSYMDAGEAGDQLTSALYRPGCLYAYLHPAAHGGLVVRHPPPSLYRLPYLLPSLSHYQSVLCCCFQRPTAAKWSARRTWLHASSGAGESMRIPLGGRRQEWSRLEGS